MIDELLTKYDNLRIDISWVIWEDVICGGGDEPIQGWIDMIEKHNTKVFIGSDNVGQFITPEGKNKLLPEIVKYYKLLHKLTPGAANNVAHKNAERYYFADWKIPEYPVQKASYPAEYLT